MPPPEVDAARPALLAHRSRRVRPGLDDKVLLSWNAWFLRALAEAAAALGMSSRTAFIRIIAPQAFRIIVPAIGNDFVAMLKDSALASTVSLHEILWRAQNIGAQKFKTLQTFMIAAVVVALVAQFVKLYYVYNAQMTQLEAQRREAVNSR